MDLLCSPLESLCDKRFGDPKQGYAIVEHILGIDCGPNMDVISLGELVLNLILGRNLFDKEYPWLALAHYQSLFGAYQIDLLQKSRNSKKYFHKTGLVR